MWSGWPARIDPERGAVVSALCLNAGVAQYPITDTDSDDAGLLWVATHGGGLIWADPERAAITRVVTVAAGLPCALLYCSTAAAARGICGCRHDAAPFC
jgi:3-polyprenyl-4-hydroxybenzoate decarboxylase